MTDTLETIRAAYNSFAELYNARVKEIPANPLDDALLDVFAGLVGESGPIADLGCGQGRLTAYLTASGHDAFGVDLSPEMLGIARATYPDLRFTLGSMTELDIADGSVAGVLSWYSIIHTPPAVVPTILAEFGRILAPGGYVLLGFFSCDDLAGEPREFDHRVTPGFRWPTARIVELLAEAGLVEVARMDREPGAEERFRHGRVLARKPPAEERPRP